MRFGTSDHIFNIHDVQLIIIFISLTKIKDIVENLDRSNDCRSNDCRSYECRINNCRSYDCRSNETTPLFRQPIIPTAHCSDGPLFRDVRNLLAP
jgi:hypothetical protein